MLTRCAFQLPDGWPIYVGFDTGTFMSATFTTFTLDPHAAITLDEFPNYRYVGGEIELLGLSNKEWAESVVAGYNFWRPGTSKVKGWVDTNTQFRSELALYGLTLVGNPKKLELRVEITRQYVQAKDPFRFYMTPWLTVLPYEMEHATFPKETTQSGKFERIKNFDHTLDTVEHVLSRRPRVRMTAQSPRESFLDRFLRENRHPALPGRNVDPHLGRA